VAISALTPSSTTTTGQARRDPATRPTASVTRSRQARPTHGNVLQIGRTTVATLSRMRTHPLVEPVETPQPNPPARHTRTRHPVSTSSTHAGERSTGPPYDRRAPVPDAHPPAGRACRDPATRRRRRDTPAPVTQVSTSSTHARERATGRSPERLDPAPRTERHAGRACRDPATRRRPRGPPASATGSRQARPTHGSGPQARHRMNVWTLSRMRTHTPVEPVETPRLDAARATHPHPSPGLDKLDRRRGTFCGSAAGPSRPGPGCAPTRWSSLSRPRDPASRGRHTRTRHRVSTSSTHAGERPADRASATAAPVG
jgi:hypothetical protein